MMEGTWSKNQEISIHSRPATLWFGQIFPLCFSASSLAEISG
jgi:hypothetical protein